MRRHPSQKSRAASERQPLDSSNAADNGSGVSSCSVGCPYATLNVPTTAAPGEIKAAYRRLALASHPDKVQPEEREAATVKFQAISRAYAVLSDPVKRQHYDEHGLLEEEDITAEEFVAQIAELIMVRTASQAARGDQVIAPQPSSSALPATLAWFGSHA
jgi:DnaJ-class molecular chaperone